MLLEEKITRTAEDEIAVIERAAAARCDEIIAGARNRSAEEYRTAAAQIDRDSLEKIISLKSGLELANRLDAGKYREELFSGFINALKKNIRRRITDNFTRVICAMIIDAGARINLPSFVVTLSGSYRELFLRYKDEIEAVLREKKIMIESCEFGDHADGLVASSTDGKVVSTATVNELVRRNMRFLEDLYFGALRHE
jgi:vacuolar-type H+-ATPase subunit E/Vma4